MVGEHMRHVVKYIHTAITNTYRATSLLILFGIVQEILVRE